MWDSHGNKFTKSPCNKPPTESTVICWRCRVTYGGDQPTFQSACPDEDMLTSNISLHCGRLPQAGTSRRRQPTKTGSACLAIQKHSTDMNCMC